MNCRETLRLLGGFMDGELDLVNNLEIEQHLRNCAECAARLEDQSALHTLLRSDALHYPAPAHLASRLQSKLRIPSERPHTPPKFRWAAGLSASVCIALAVWAMAARINSANQQKAMVREMVCSHLRSLLATRPTDTTSGDTEQINRLFSGKLNYVPPVVDLKAEGFPLLGGRLDYIAYRPVAALVYRHQTHTVNLFLWPTTSAPLLSPDEATLRGCHLLHWNANGVTYWAVSDLDPQELQIFGLHIQTRVSMTHSLQKCD